MKLIIVFFLMTLGVCAQHPGDKEVIHKTYLLSHTVFGTKDSMVLEQLFAKNVSYGHSKGNIQTRQEAIASISRNRSVYTDTSVSRISVLFQNDVAITRHLFRAVETNQEGKVTNLNFSMMLVWIKERGSWKLMGRQAVAIP